MGKRFFLPRVIVPKRWLRIQDSHVYMNNPYWYFYWEPEVPCKLCESGEIVKLNKLNAISTPKVIHIHWYYIPYEADACRLNMPLGLNFDKGDLSYLPKFMKTIVFDFITKKEKFNIVSLFEYQKMVKNKEIKPYSKTIEQLKRGDEPIIIKDRRKRRKAPCYTKEHRLNISKGWKKRMKQLKKEKQNAED